VFGEFAQSFNLDGRLFYLDESSDIQEFSYTDRDVFGRFLLGMGQDADGEMYALVNQTGVPFENTGEVLRIDPPVKLSIQGDCPGAMTAHVEGITPNGTVAFVYSTGLGNAEVSGRPVCNGTVLGLNESHRLLKTVTADANGNAQIGGFVSADRCGKFFLQAVDITSGPVCNTSNVELIE
jgi:hypothetical protein